MLPSDQTASNTPDAPDVPAARAAAIRATSTAANPAIRANIVTTRILTPGELSALFLGPRWIGDRHERDTRLVANTSVPMQPMTPAQTIAAAVPAIAFTATTSNGPRMKISSWKVASAAYADSSASGSSITVGHMVRDDEASGGRVAPSIAPASISSGGTESAGRAARSTAAARVATAQGTSTTVWPWRSISRDRTGEVRLMPIAYAAVTAPARR